MQSRAARASHKLINNPNDFRANATEEFRLRSRGKMSLVTGLFLSSGNSCGIDADAHCLQLLGAHARESRTDGDLLIRFDRTRDLHRTTRLRHATLSIDQYRCHLNVSERQRRAIL